MRICTVEGCGAKHHTRGYCKQHYGELFYRPIERSQTLAFVDMSPAWQNALGQLIRDLPAVHTSMRAASLASAVRQSKGGQR